MTSGKAIRSARASWAAFMASTTRARFASRSGSAESWARATRTSVLSLRALLERPGEDEPRDLGAVLRAAHGLQARRGRLAGAQSVRHGGESLRAVLAGERGEPRRLLAE